MMTAILTKAGKMADATVRSGVTIPTWLAAIIATALLVPIVSGVTTWRDAGAAVAKNIEQDGRLNIHDSQIGYLQTTTATLVADDNNSKETLKDINKKLDFLVGREMDRGNKR